MCLVNGQGHYFWSIVNGVLAIFLQLILKCNLCKYTALHIIYAALVEIVKIAAVIMFSVFIVSNIISLAAVPITHQEFIKQCRCVQNIRQINGHQNLGAIKSKVSYSKRLEVKDQGEILASQDFDCGRRLTYRLQ